MRFSYRMVPGVYQVFWAGMARGEFITDAAAEADTYHKGHALGVRGWWGPPATAITPPSQCPRGSAPSDRVDQTMS